MLSTRPHRASRPWRDDPASFAQPVPSTVATGIDAPGIMQAASETADAPEQASSD